MACVWLGQRVLDGLDTASSPIRAALMPKDEYLTRGTSHLLASEDLTAGYWHPKLLHKRVESTALAPAYIAVACGTGCSRDAMLRNPAYCAAYSLYFGAYS